MRNATSSCGLSILQFSTCTSRTSPEVSLPMVTPPCPSFITQFLTIILWLGTPTRRPSRLRPLLMAMQSSPVSNSQSSISTSLDDSGLHPSLFGPWLEIFTFRTVTFLHNTGLISHIGELRIVTPSINTFVQRYGWMNGGLSQLPSPKARSFTGTSLSAATTNAFRAGACVGSPFFPHPPLPDQFHQK